MTKLYCPKGHLLPFKHKIFLSQVPTGEDIERMPCTLCGECGSIFNIQKGIYFIKDCVTEEQLKKLKLKESSNQLESKNGCAHLWEVLYCKDGIVIAQCKECEKYSFAGDYSGHTASFPKPTKFFNIDLLCEAELTLDRKWINFSDMKPKIGQKIEGRMDKSSRIFEGEYVRESKINKWGYLVKTSNNKMLFNCLEFTEWRPAEPETTEESSVVSTTSKTEAVVDSCTRSEDMYTKEQECDHEWSADWEEFRMQLRDENEPIPMIPLRKSYCKKCNITKPIEKYKSQSQIAIQKVIQALESNLHGPGPRSDPVSKTDLAMVLTQITQKLKELNDVCTS